VVGCDLVVTGSTDALARMASSQTRALVNASVTPTAEFVKNPNWQLPGSDMQADIRQAAKHAEFVPATELAAGLMGDAIATNMFMLGYAYQKGWIPLSGAALERAIELNGVAVEFNRRSFLWGRRAAVDLERVRRLATPADVIPLEQRFSRNLDEILERRVKFLTAYQDEKYAAKYKALVDRVRSRDEKLAEAVARNYAKLLAYKDEYEVARLHADPAFRRKIEAMFEGDYRVAYHLSPPLLATIDPASGEPRKMRFGPWMLPVFRLLASLRGLRGGALDVFGYTAERRMERKLIAEYEETVATLLAGLSSANHATALQIAALPEEIRGFGHIKAKSAEAARKKRETLLAEFHHPKKERAAA
jgi:indolepyruvate ferredoxin oxidoreductase